MSKRKTNKIDRKKFENFRDMVLEKEKEGKVVIAAFEGFREIDINDLVNQPVDGILYDLNRNGETILTFIEDIKWVNDYACNLVIKKLKSLLEMEQNKNKKS